MNLKPQIFNEFVTKIEFYLFCNHFAILCFHSFQCHPVTFRLCTLCSKRISQKTLMFFSVLLLTFRLNKETLSVSCWKYRKNFSWKTFVKLSDADIETIAKLNFIVTNGHWPCNVEYSTLTNLQTCQFKF